ADGRATGATVIRASPTIDAASGTREIVLEPVAGSDFRPGASVAVRLGAERRRIVAIPRGAIAEAGYVLVWENGRTVLRAVSLAAQGLPFGPAAVEAFAAKLRQLGLVERSLAERSVLLMERVRAERRRRLRNPHAGSSLLRMRWALADPDQWLERWLPRLRVCFSRPFLVASVGLFAVYAFVAWTQWPDLAHALATLTRPASYTLEMFLV